MDAAFAGYSSSAFTVQTESSGRESATFGLELSWDIKNNLALACSYEATIASDRVQHTGEIGLKYVW
jgi:uncharacterized protein with beta-barrel porin domain